MSFTDSDQRIRSTAVERFTKHIKLAEQLSALVIIGLIRGMTPVGQSKESSLTYLVDSLKECAEAAAVHGVQLVLEPLNRYETDLINNAQQGMDLINQVGTANLGLLLDTFHMNIEEQCIEDTIRKYGEHINYFHVADSNRLHPGAGHLDFKSILHTLLATGYKGWISGEFMPIPDPDTASRNNIRFLTSILG